jgi:hypothetical protein
LTASASARSSARWRAYEKRKSEDKDPLLEGKRSFGESRNYIKSNVALPLRAVALSRNLMNWEPRSIRFFIKGYQETKSGENSQWKANSTRVKILAERGQYKSKTKEQTKENTRDLRHPGRESTNSP